LPARQGVARLYQGQLHLSFKLACVRGGSGRPYPDVGASRELGIAPVLIDRLGEDVHSDCLTITRLAELSHLLDPHAL